MYKTISIITLILISTLTINAQKTKNSKLYADKSKSSITYAMNHPLHSWIAVSHDVSSVILYDKDNNVINQAAVSVNISSFDSKNANRDSHTIEVTEALKYPKITFLSKSITFIENTLEISGTLSFHGVSKNILVKAIKKTKKKQVEIIGDFVIKMSEYNIEPPSLMGMAADDDIKISFDIIF